MPLFDIAKAVRRFIVESRPAITQKTQDTGKELEEHSQPMIDPYVELPQDAEDTPVS